MLETTCRTSRGSADSADSRYTFSDLSMIDLVRGLNGAAFDPFAGGGDDAVLVSDPDDDDDGMIPVPSHGVLGSQSRRRLSTNMGGLRSRLSNQNLVGFFVAQRGRDEDSKARTEPKRHKLSMRGRPTSMELRNRIASETLSTSPAARGGVPEQTERGGVPEKTERGGVPEQTEGVPGLTERGGVPEHTERGITEHTEKRSTPEPAESTDREESIDTLQVAGGTKALLKDEVSETSLVLLEKPKPKKPTRKAPAEKAPGALPDESQKRDEKPEVPPRNLKAPSKIFPSEKIPLKNVPPQNTPPTNVPSKSVFEDNQPPQEQRRNAVKDTQERGLGNPVEKHKSRHAALKSLDPGQATASNGQLIPTKTEVEAKSKEVHVGTAWMRKSASSLFPLLTRDGANTLPAFQRWSNLLGSNSSHANENSSVFLPRPSEDCNTFSGAEFLQHDIEPRSSVPDCTERGKRMYWRRLIQGRFSWGRKSSKVKEEPFCNSAPVAVNLKKLVMEGEKPLRPSLKHTKREARSEAAKGRAKSGNGPATEIKGRMVNGDEMKNDEGRKSGKVDKGACGPAGTKHVSGEAEPKKTRCAEAKTKNGSEPTTKSLGQKAGHRSNAKSNEAKNKKKFSKHKKSEGTLKP